MNELTLRNLLEVGKQSIENKTKLMIIEVKAYDSEPEIIINPKENFSSKLEYYSKAYNENLTLKTNENIRIIKYDFVESLSDGYHTFDELYYHRMVLFAIICNTYKDKAWKSWKHDDGTMFDDYFIVGITTPEGNFTYHYNKDYWDMFKIKELVKAPKWDGHEPKDIVRLLSLT